MLIIQKICPVANTLQKGEARGIHKMGAIYPAYKIGEGDVWRVTQMIHTPNKEDEVVSLHLAGPTCDNTVTSHQLNPHQIMYGKQIN